MPFEIDPVTIRALQVQYRYTHMWLGLIGNAILAVFVTLALWGTVPPLRLFTWLTIYIVIFLSRIAIGSFFRKAAPSGEGSATWGTLDLYCTPLTGLVWGATAIFLLPENSAVHRVILTLVALVMAGGATYANAPLKSSQVLFLLAVLVPFAGRYFYEGGEVNIAVGASISAIALALMAAARRIRETITESLKARYQVERLVALLVEQKSRSEQLNVELRNEIEERRKAEEDLRRSEERYRLLAENSLTGVLIHQDGIYVYVNERLAEITGYSVDELIGRDFLDIVHPDQRDQVRDIIRKRYSGESIPRVYELRLLHKNGDTKWGQIMATTINYRGRDAIMGNLVDITDRKKSEGLIRQADRFRAVADLTSGIAHNFNNLLQIVIGNANLGVMNLQSGDLADAKENLEQIEESARFGAETVNRLNRYARGSTDDQTAAIEVFDLCDLVAQAAEMSKPWWKTEPEKRGTRISLYTRLKSGCTIRGKKNEMFEVLVNLIRNSVEALPEGGDIEIETAVENNAVALRVRDTGIGIPRKNLDRLFTPFFTTSVQVARGLGLATCRRIVDAHGGTILVESVEGKGATFTITLPLVTEEPLPSEVAESKSAEKALTILAVDDLEATVRILKAGLGRLGHKVFTALSGQEAVTMLNENPIDLVICDLGMPEMNGWQVGRAIKEICKERGTPRPAFIILTGWENPGHEKERISESGVDAVVQKPVDITKLLEVIREVL
jgi:PAS domain S-box-containing protein